MGPPPSKMETLEIKFKSTMQETGEKFGVNTRSVINEVTTLRPSPDTPANDPKWKNYMELLIEVNNMLAKTIDSFTALIQAIRRLIKSFFGT